MSIVLRKPKEIEVEAVKVEIQNVLVDSINNSSQIPESIKSEIEKIVKDVVTVAIKDAINEIKKTSFGNIDKDGDGVVTMNEVKEAVGDQAKKIGCNNCTII